METSTVLFQLISNHLFLQELVGQIINRVMELSMTRDDFEILVNSNIIAHSIRP